MSCLAQESATRKVAPLHDLPDKELLLGLLAECLSWCGMDCTARVLATESGLGTHSPPPRTVLAHQMGVRLDPNAPVLASVLRSCQAGGDKGHMPLAEPAQAAAPAVGAVGVAPGLAAFAARSAALEPPSGRPAPLPSLPGIGLSGMRAEESSLPPLGRRPPLGKGRRPRQLVAACLHCWHRHNQI